MTLSVFVNIGDRMSVAEAYHKLIALFSGRPCSENRAGSLGGAVYGGTIILKNGFYERIR